MALTFGGATSDRVSIAAHASINASEASIVSALVRFYIGTITAGRYIVAKNAVDGNGGFRVSVRGGGEIRVQMSCTTVDAFAESTSLGLSVNTWYDGHFVYEPGAGQEARIYVTPAGADAWTEPSYTGVTSHVGTTTGNPALTLGNNSNASPTSGLQGRIAMAQWKVGAIHTDQERALWQHGLGHLVSAGMTMNVGWDGTGTQRNISGNNNNGTVTGATFVAHPPLAMPFHDWQVCDDPYVVASSPAAARRTNRILTQAVKRAAYW